MDLVIRAVIVYAVILIFTRILGRRELSSLQPFDLILLVVIGDLIQQGVTQNDLSVTGVVIILSTIGVLQVLVSFVVYRFRRLRPVLNGEPVVIVQDGQPIERNMRRERITVDDIAEQARLNQIESLEQIKFAVLETSGQISFIKKEGE
jgi:uncharacterized membrane protein YcaP (DUF421 family)